MAERKMDSREFGLVFAQQLFAVEDLHYGFWSEDLEPSLLNFKTAQQRYTDFLIEAIPPKPEATGGVRVLDIGCGTGHTLVQMLDRGYRADGLVPAPAMAEQVRARLRQRGEQESRLFECTLQAMPAAERNQQYDVALFSESFQYVPMSQAFSLLETIVKPGGYVVICDFFKTEHAGDGQPGDRSFGGGHRYTDFQQLLKDLPFEVLRDEDITRNLSPNLALVNSVLMQRVAPALGTLNRYLQDNKPWLAWLIHLLFRKKFAKIRYKYLSGLRSQETFERYKTYHLIVLRYQPA